MNRTRTRVLLGGFLLVALVVASTSVGFTVGRARGEQRQAAPRAASPLAASLTSVASLPDLPLAPLQNARIPGSIDDDRQFVLGGIGSDLWRAPTDPPDEFWMVTDRGPNDKMKVGRESRRIFPVPGYTPFIARVRVVNEEIEVLETIPIVGRSGEAVTGLPNTATHEEPFDYSGLNRLPLNPSGLDVEGLVRMPSGEFWLVEEYGPSLVRVSPDGTVIRRFVPSDLVLEGADYPVTANLPAIFSLRTPNRGFEGLTLSQDASTLYLAVQSPLSNPDEKAGKQSRLVRILAFDIASEQVVGEYAYPVGWEAEPKAPKAGAAAKPERAAKPGAASKPERATRPNTKQTRISALATVGPGRLMVLERTDAEARLYLADLAGTSNLLGSSWDDPSAAPSLELLSDAGAAGVIPLTRTLLADLSPIPGLPQKIEGIAIVDGQTVAVANDNDFDLGELDADGNNLGEGVRSQILLVRLPQPLY